MDIIQSVQHAGKTVNLYVDPISPYEEDTLTQISHWHPRYDLGSQVEPGITAEEMIEEAEERDDPILAILPLFLFDHSGISVSTKAFSCRWDSGQVGWVHVTRSRSDMVGCQGWSLEQYEKAIHGDIQTFDSYLTGSVYGYEVEGRDGDHLHSCWGFYDQEDCLGEGKRAAEYEEDPADTRTAEELSGRVTYASV